MEIKSVEDRREEIKAGGSERFNRGMDCKKSVKVIIECLLDDAGDAGHIQMHPYLDLIEDALKAAYFAGSKQQQRER